MERTMDWSLTNSLMGLRRRDVLKVISSCMLIVWLPFLSCKSDAGQGSSLQEEAPQAPNLIPQETCRPQLLQVPEENVKIQVGAWQFVFNVLLVGCGEDLSRLAPAQVHEVVELATREIQERGLRIVGEFKSPAFRAHFRAVVAKRLGTEAVSDIYLNLLAAGESM